MSVVPTAPNLLQRIAFGLDEETCTFIETGARAGKTFSAAMLADREISNDRGDIVYVATSHTQTDYFVSTLSGLRRIQSGWRRVGPKVRQLRYGSGHTCHVIGRSALPSFAHCDYRASLVLVDDADALDPEHALALDYVRMRHHCRTVLYATTIALDRGDLVAPRPRPAWTQRDGWDYILVAQGALLRCP